MQTITVINNGRIRKCVSKEATFLKDDEVFPR